MISFTSSAKSEILKTLSNLPSASGLYLRIGIKGASCDGSLLIGLDKKKEDDELHVFDEIPLIIAKKHLMHVIGTHISFIQNNDEGSFKAVIV